MTVRREYRSGSILRKAMKGYFLASPI